MTQTRRKETRNNMETNIKMNKIWKKGARKAKK